MKAREVVMELFKQIKWDSVKSSVDEMDHCSHCLALYYITKTLVPFENGFKFLTGDLYKNLEQGINFYSSALTETSKKVTSETLSSSLNMCYLECLFRILRAR